MDDLAKDTALIRALVQHCNLAPATVAKRAGVSTSTIYRPYNGTATTRLGRAVLNKLQAAFPDFPGWEDAGVVSKVSDRRLPFRSAAPGHDPDMVGIEHIDLRYGLGGTYVDMPVVAEIRQFSRSWLREFTSASPENLFWTVGTGDSMEPTIRSGQLILIDRSQVTPRTGDEIWAIAYGDVGMIKRLLPLPDGRVEVMSDNQVVRSFVAADGELHVIGRVIATVRRL